VGRFVNRVTQVLGNVFNFEGTQSSISRLDLSGAIQPVFDLSRGAGLAKSVDFGTSLGLVGLRLGNGHVAAGVLFSSAIDIYAVEAAFFEVPEDQLWIWIMDVSAYANGNPANFLAAQVSIQDPDIQGTAEGATRGRLIYRANALDASMPLDSGGHHSAFWDSGPNHVMPMPYLLTPGATIQAATEAVTGACDIFIPVRLWVGPRFVMPPGLG